MPARVDNVHVPKVIAAKYHVSWVKGVPAKMPARVGNVHVPKVIAAKYFVPRFPKATGAAAPKATARSRLSRAGP